MVNIDELKKGNVVLYKGSEVILDYIINNRPFDPCIITKDGNSIKISDIVPISYDKNNDILLKFGFSRDDDDKSFYYKGKICILFYENENTISFLAENGKEYYNRNAPIRKELHLLQNLYEQVTGQKLKLPIPSK